MRWGQSRDGATLSCPNRKPQEGSLLLACVRAQDAKARLAGAP